MKKRYLAILALAALPATVAVAAQGHHMAGGGCLAGYGSSNLYTRGANMLNWDSNAVQATCPIDFTSTSTAPVTVNPVGARVDVFDLHGSQSIRCQLQTVSTTNTFVNSAYRYSCNVAGGCATDASPGSTGTTNLNIPDDIASTANVVGMAVVCDIPAFDISFGASGIMGASTAI